MTAATALLPVAFDAVALASEIVRTRLPGVVTAKNERDMATEVDFAVERAVREYLRETRAQRVRMFGSAAIDLAWLAEGKTDATVMLSNKPWDTAAGVIIAREAGAEVVDEDGSPHELHSRATIAATPPLLDAILDVVSKAQAEIHRS